MSEHNQDYINKVFELAEKYAGTHQFMNDLSNRLGSYNEDNKRNFDKIDKKLEDLNRILADDRKAHREDITEVESKVVDLESERKAAKKVTATWVAAAGVVGGFLGKLSDKLFG